MSNEGSHAVSAVATLRLVALGMHGTFFDKREDLEAFPLNVTSISTKTDDIGSEAGLRKEVNCT